MLTRIIATLAFVASLAGCGGPAELESTSSALKASQIWTSSTPVAQGGQLLYCGGYSYMLRVATRQYLQGGTYYTGLQGTPSQAMDSSRNEFGIWCGNDNAMTNFENALASAGPQVCYSYNHRAGETTWSYDGAISMPKSGIYYAPRGSFNPNTGVYYTEGYWRLTFATYTFPPDGNGRVLSCFGGYGNVTVDLY